MFDRLTYFSPLVETDISGVLPARKAVTVSFYSLAVTTELLMTELLMVVNTTSATLKAKEIKLNNHFVHLFCCILFC